MKQLLRILFVVKFIFIFFQNGNCQSIFNDPNEVIKISIDLEKGVLSTALPFDREFVLEIITSDELILSKNAFLYEVYTGFNSDKTKYDRDLLPIDESKAVNNTIKPIYNLDIQNTGKNKYIVNVHSLEPNTKYDIVLLANFNKSEIQKFIEILFLEKNGKLNDAKKEYNKLKTSKEKTTYLHPREFWNEDFEEFKKAVGISQEINELFNDVIPNKNILIEDLREVTIEANKNKLHTERLSILSQFIIDDNFFKSACIGQNNLENNNEVKKSDILGRIKNYENSIKTLQNLKSDIYAILGFKEYVKATSLLTQIDSHIKYMVERKQILQDNFDACSLKILNNVQYGIWIANSTISNNLETRTGQRLVTDFGLSFIVPHSYKGDFNLIPRPYFGVNYQFRPIDKEQSFETIPNLGFWHKSSISIGVTIGKIDIDDYSDFYNSMSLLLGYNYRIEENIRIGVGTALIKEENINPIINSKVIRVAPYASISFDFRLFSQIGNGLSKFLK